MNRKTKIIVSVVGITIVTLALLGITYAYYLTRIEGNTNTNSISITTADLVLKYADRTENIDFNGIQPGFTKTKEFTVTNDGNNKVTDYRVYLENVINNLERNTDLVYTLTCTSNDTVNSPCTNQVTEETTFPGINTTLVLNSLDVDDTHTYTLTVHYKEMNIDQSIDMNKNISAKINIYDKNSKNENTIVNYILSQGVQVLNTNTNQIEIDKTYTEKNIINKAADGTDMSDSGIFTAPDDYGLSYYYRGPVKNNYVNFAGFTWRIVRINGDDSVRLILDGTLDKVKHENESDYVFKNEALYALDTDGIHLFNSSFNDNAYVGYMYGDFEGNSTSYNEAHSNIKSSDMKTYLETFYSEYLLEYQDYIADTLFCADKTLASAGTGDIENDKGYGNPQTYQTYFKASERLGYIGRWIAVEVEPTLECAKGATNKYSRYTSKIDMNTRTNKGVEINNDLTYPIALLTADEILLAGVWKDGTYGSYIPSYLMDGYKYETPTIYTRWWTMTPCRSIGSVTPDLLFAMYANTSNLASEPLGQSPNGVRPVINLRSDNLILSGDGTIDAPYILKERDK